MTHLTLNTGHAVSLPPNMVWPETRYLLTPIILAGRGNLPGQASAYRVEITREPGTAAFTFYRGREPLSINVVCTDPASQDLAWKGLEQVYMQLSDLNPQMMAASAFPDRPTLPWLGTVILPSMGLLAQQDAGMVGHMEACFGLIIASL